MYGFKCAHCGQIELAHLDEIDYHLEQELRYIPDKEYAEEFQVANLNELIEMLGEQQEGYSCLLIACPGFDYGNVDIEKLTERVSEYPQGLEYLPDSLQKKVSQGLRKQNQ
jgi:hypothetical protein